MRKDKVLDIGVDVGNFDTKTQNTVIPSGFVSYTDAPYKAKECLFLNSRYYKPSQKRFPYVENKTENENMYVLTLLAIANEIIFWAEKEVAKRTGAEKNRMETSDVQAEIESIAAINLGMGVPLNHYSRYKKAYIEYYRDRMDKGVTYEYGGYKFNFTLNKIDCYPQDIAAVVTYKPKKVDSIVNAKKPTYYAVDIGGWTVDIVSIVNNEFDDKGTSKSLGVLAMYENIINEVDIQTGAKIEAIDIEDILRDDDSFVSEEVKKIVNDYARTWFDTIVNVMAQNKMLIDARPVLFIGGGSQLFKKYIKECGKFVKYEFIANPKANARGYAKLISRA